MGINIVQATATTNPTNPKAWSFTTAAVERAVEQTKYLMELYRIDTAHVIRHYDVNGKQCPGIIGWNADTGNERPVSYTHLTLPTTERV